MCENTVSHLPPDNHSSHRLAHVESHLISRPLHAIAATRTRGNFRSLVRGYLVMSAAQFMWVRSFHTFSCINNIHRYGKCSHRAAFNLIFLVDNSCSTRVMGGRGGGGPCCCNCNSTPSNGSNGWMTDYSNGLRGLQWLCATSVSHKTANRPFSNKDVAALDLHL